MKKKRYRVNNRLLRNVNATTGMVIAESVGAGVVFKVAGSDPKLVGIAKTGTSFAGVPSMVSGAGSVIGSLGMLSPRRSRGRKKKK
jgi:hypothetical protein